MPNIEGINSFGTLVNSTSDCSVDGQKYAMHTARWNHTVDLNNKCVGVIGTGPSCVQARFINAHY